MLRWFSDNLGSLLMAFVLALVVWVGAINEQDPIQTRNFPNPIKLEYEGLGEGLLIVDGQPREGEITLRAPANSVWNQLTKDDIHLRVDLTGLGPGTYVVPVSPSVDRQPVRIIDYSPQEVQITLETARTRQVVISVRSRGEPAVGYQLGDPVVTPENAQVSGPASVVDQVAALRASVDVAGRRQDVDVEVTLVPVDADGRPVAGVEVSPQRARVLVPVEQLGGQRAVAVVPIIEGQVEPGYRVTNITVTPTLVTLTSSDPQAVDLLPGFVETEPVSLTGAQESIERRVPLRIPQGFSVVGDQLVLVQVTIEAIESSITLTRTLEFQGLDNGISAAASPQEVSVILNGPLPTLEQLQPEDVRVVLDILGLGPGTYQIEPQVIIIPTDIVVQTILPDNIEVTITQGSPTPTPTLTPAATATP